ncbi:response regulator [Paramagnetospirillum kuznetsovii]|nr:response regulator [Paramagnetospirillum kuznetsovii]
MTCILVVDDDPICLELLSETLIGAGYSVDLAVDGEDAWDKLNSYKHDLVLLDRVMPRLDGLGLLRRMKGVAALSGIPVIIQTSASSQDEIREGLEAGAHYYLCKPVYPDLLCPLVAGIVADIAERKSLRDCKANVAVALSLMTSGDFMFRTLDDVRSLAAVLAELCDRPDDVGMGLLELMINAVEHGNLGISYTEKSELRKTWRWEQEISRRLGVAPWSSRVARVRASHDCDDVVFVISDEGVGFDPGRFMQMEPARAFDLHGRGIAMANAASFSRLEYQGRGNVVMARAPARRDC